MNNGTAWRRGFGALVVSALLLTMVGSDTLVAGSADDPYEPRINPTEFSFELTNKYFRLRPGMKFTYLKMGLTKKERTEVEVLGNTKIVMGVKTIVVRSREWGDDVLKEDTYDWYAQDKEGNVWYFGEQVANYEDGKMKNNAGSWEAGVDGALPGIVMPGNPKVGQTHRQEYYKGGAEDMVTIVSVDESVKVAFGSYDGCVKIRNWSKLESGAENKTFCAQVGFMVVEEPVGETGLMSPRNELVDVSTK